MPNFIPYDLNQSEMVVINYQDQLQPGTLEHAIHHPIEHRLDLSFFFSSYQNDATRKVGSHSNPLSAWQQRIIVLNDVIAAAKWWIVAPLRIRLTC